MKEPDGMRGGCARDCAAALGGGPLDSLVVLLERSDVEDALRLCVNSLCPFGYGWLGPTQLGALLPTRVSESSSSSSSPGRAYGFSKLGWLRINSNSVWLVPPARLPSEFLVRSR